MAEEYEELAYMGVEEVVEDDVDYVYTQADEKADNMLQYVETDSVIMDCIKEEYAEEDDMHMVLVQSIADEKKVYQCAQCNIEFATIEAFREWHAKSIEEQNELLQQTEQQWEALDDDVSNENDKDEEIEYTMTKYESDVAYDNTFEHIIKEETVCSSGVQQDVQYLEHANDKVEHYLEEDSNDVYCCNDCGGMFNELANAEQHICDAVNVAATEVEFEAVDDVEMKKIPVVHRSELTSKATIIATIHDGKVGYKCAECDRVFNTTGALSKHSRVHKQQAKAAPARHIRQSEHAICSICNTAFSSERNLKLHMKIHNKRALKSIQEVLPADAKEQYNELNQFYCEICNKSFDQNLLSVHKNMHQNINEFTCRICNKQYGDETNFDLHMQVHAAKPNGRVFPVRIAPTDSTKMTYACQYCEREFKRPFEKVKHERIHTGEKPYECEVCGKKFRVSYSLTMHLRTHTDIRPYVCATCNKRFKSHPVYVHHMRTHIDEWPYKCDVCPKAFRTSVQLCGHKLRHTKPFNCPDCTRPFATLYDVRLHMKTHNNVSKTNEHLKHTCNICGAVYARVFALRLHLKEQHALELQGNKALVDLEAVVLNATDDDDVAEVSAEENVPVSMVEVAAVDETQVATQQLTQMQAHEMSTHAILQNEEIIVDNFHTEEIVAADWLTK